MMLIVNMQEDPDMTRGWMTERSATDTAKSSSDPEQA